MLTTTTKPTKKELVSHLKHLNFFRDSMGGCSVVEISDYLEKHQIFDLFFKVVYSMKIRHFTLTKVVLILLSTLQIDFSILADEKLS